MPTETAPKHPRRIIILWASLTLLGVLVYVVQVLTSINKELPAATTGKATEHGVSMMPTTQDEEDYPQSKIVIIASSNLTGAGNQSVGPFASIFEIEDPEEKWRSNTIGVRVHNFNASRYYSVLASITNTYIIAATQVKTTTRDSLDFHLQIRNQGTYEVQVLETELREKMATAKLQNPAIVTPSPFSVSLSVHSSQNIHRAKRPPCQMDATSVALGNGDWMGPNAAEVPKMRTGWAFQPQQCDLEVLGPQEIFAMDQTTVAVLGTSRERGIFLSMVDIVLLADEKENLKLSTVGKCWGRASVKVNHVKLIYQDMRTHLFDQTETPDSFTCHGDKLAAGSGLYANGTEMFDILMESESLGVVVLWSGCWLRDLIKPGFDQSQCSRNLLTFLSRIPDQWDGKIFVTAGPIVAHEPSLTREQFSMYIENLKAWAYRANDTRVKFLDVHGMVSPMGLYAERPGVVRGSTHLHRWCKQGDIRVCSNVTEALAQFVLGTALLPNGKTKSSAKAPSTSITERAVEICTDCPRNLLPFHIIPHPNLTCYGPPLLVTEAAGGTYVTPSCPKDCLETVPPSGEAQTQSGPVDIRVCRVGNQSIIDLN